MLVYFLARIQLEQSGRHLTSRRKIDRMAGKSLSQQESGKAKVAQGPREIRMFVFSGKWHLVKNATMYCFLSKTIQPVNLREINSNK